MTSIPREAPASVAGDALAHGRIFDWSPRANRGWLMRRLLLAADLLGLVLAFLLAGALLPAAPSADTVGSHVELVLFLVSLPLWVVLFRLHGLYDRDEELADHSTVDDVVGVTHTATIGTWGFLVFSLASGLADPQIPRLVVFWILAITLVTLLRAAARTVARRTSSYTQRTIIVGSGHVGRLVARKIAMHPEYGIDVLGFVDRDPHPAQSAPGVHVLGTPTDLPDLVRAHGVDRVIVAFSTDPHEQTLEDIRSLQEVDVQVDIVPRLFEVVGSHVNVHNVEGVPLLGLPPLRLSHSSRFLKRSLDVAGSVLGLVVLSPLLLAAAVAIKLESPGPVFFRQVRMGAGGETFRIFKLRTMVADAEARKSACSHLNVHRDGDARMFKVASDPRVTRVGRILRRTSVDELPQLLNVLTGKMSLVGPRPLILDEDRHVEAWARKRLALKPGITGLWQVLGRSDIPFEEMTKLDYLYVTNWSLTQDLRLIFLTLPALGRPRKAF